MDIVKIIGEYVKLRKTGAQNYTGLCPFHKEKSGSFSVNATHGYFYCFGCHEKGDVFTFVMKMDVVSFPEAVRRLRRRPGFRCRSGSFRRPTSGRGGDSAAADRSARGGHAVFRGAVEVSGSGPGEEYLTGRGVTPQTISTFRIGYAPDDFNDMRDRLKAHFTDEAMRASGLFSSSEKDDDGQPTGQLYRVSQADYISDCE